jgi:hypothetical protein
MPYALEPHVAGELGPATRFVDRSVHPPVVADVDYVLDYPDTDDLIESFPVFLVSEPLAARLSEHPGLGFEPAIVLRSDGYAELHGDAPHKPYVRLLIGDGPDAWIDDELRLCVSDRLMTLLREFDLRRCDVTAL